MTVRLIVQGATFSMCGQLYHGHCLMINPLHGHGEVVNENPLILPCTFSIVGALVLLKRRAGKKIASSAFRLAYIYILSLVELIPLEINSSTILLQLRSLEKWPT